MQDLNHLQMKVLKELLFKPNLRFNDILTKVDITSDLLAYHLRTLKTLKYIEIVEDLYVLTSAGKEFANRMDTDSAVLEKQPKVCVLLIVTKIVKGKKYLLIQKRTKEPYYGYMGFLTGKVRYGETIPETAQRELTEETGLTAKTFNYCYLLHEMVYSKEGEQLEDKFFNVVEVKDTEGDLINSEAGENEWYAEDEFPNIKPKYHSEDEIYNWYKTKDKTFKEFKYYIEKF